MDDDARTVWPISDDADDLTVRGASDEERDRSGSAEPFDVTARFDDGDPRVGDSRVVIARGSELAIQRVGPDDTVRVVPPHGVVSGELRDDTRIGPPVATVQVPRRLAAIPAILPIPVPPIPKLKVDSNPERTVHASALDYARVQVAPPFPAPRNAPVRRVQHHDHTRRGIVPAPPPAPPPAPLLALPPAPPPVDPRRTITTGEGDTQPAELSFRDRDSFGRFTILDTLGTGGMGVVLSAYDPQLDRKVAIKILRPRGLDGDRYAKEAERLLAEARSIAQLSHPHVITVYEAGTIDGRVYVAMEYVAGQTLRAWLAERPRSVDQIVDVLVKAGRGLAAGHRAGLVHRDFKPDNILIGHDGCVRVIDFGLAVPPGPVEQDSDREHRLVGPTGTPMYMAPEQHERRSLDARTDQFAFCVSLYEALYRRTPFPATSYPLLVHAVAAGEVIAPAPDPRIAPRIVTTVLRGLSASPDRRFATMDALLEQLAPPPRSKRNHAAAWMAAVAMFAAVTTLVIVRVADNHARAVVTSPTPSPSAEQLRVAVESFTSAITAQPHDPKAALAGHLRAQRILDDIAPDHVYLGLVLVGIAECRVRLNDPIAAIAPAERGLELVTRMRDPVQLARARYALAKALWMSNRDRPRAAQLASEARSGFAASSETAATGLSAIDEWSHETGALVGSGP